MNFLKTFLLSCSKKYISFCYCQKYNLRLKHFFKTIRPTNKQLKFKVKKLKNFLKNEDFSSSPSVSFLIDMQCY